MNETKQGNPVFTIMILLIINAINGIAAAAVGLMWWDNALSAFGLVLAIGALIIAMNIRTLKMEWWNYAVIINIIGLVLYFLTSWEFAILGIVLCVLTLLLLFYAPIRQQFK